MGRGDKKSRKGKIFRGSYGVSRPRKTDVAVIVPAKKKAEPKKKIAVKKKRLQKNKIILLNLRWK